MNKRGKTKTFGLKSPRDLHRKLLFDIERLKKANLQNEARYAAIDCAVDSWHLVDWVLHRDQVDDANFTRLTGGRKRDETKGERGKFAGKTVEASFAETQKDRLPALKFCRMLANSVKHREVRDDSMPELWNGSSYKLTWEMIDGERSIKSATLFVYVEYESEKHHAFDLFEEMADQWRTFLTEEGLFEPILDDEVETSDQPR
ncbi:hypothetical protein QA648_12540 [Rhizobium sp. CB3171]|uniref:hypothetical protein n=1 Tax=Rhizobium sp. CB3171 TaxID=3039157 RepID=UPI0024B1CB6F|nr:hypothetical protein [Rhizobium sp. CB3171]WFU00980.1 hypothetical protein QA648_12540 [Rhizobium sp. CB3171]